jgi:hypothetical protein
MFTTQIKRWLRTTLLAALVPCAGCCSFWERHCGYSQGPAYYGGQCCCPTGYAPAPAPTTTFQPAPGCRCP